MTRLQGMKVDGNLQLWLYVFRVRGVVRFQCLCFITNERVNEKRSVCDIPDRYGVDHGSLLGSAYIRASMRTTYSHGTPHVPASFRYPTLFGTSLGDSTRCLLCT